MEKLDKLKLLVSKGFTADIETGLITSPKGKVLTQIHTTGYILISVRVKNKVYGIKAHQFIYYLATGEVVEQIDHVNGIRHENRISNLRSATNTTNQWNRKGIKGYHWKEKNKKWQVSISLNNKTKYIGLYDTELEAKEAYNEAHKKYHTL